MISIPWDDGSGDNFYLDISQVNQSNNITITSDINLTGLIRFKTLTFTNKGSRVILGTLRVTQVVSRSFNGSDDLFVDINLEPFYEK